MIISLIKKISAVTVILLFAASCTRNIKEDRISGVNAKYNFIFASDSTEFKDSIREKLVVKYRDQANINLINIDKIIDIKAKDHDVVLIIDTCMGGTSLNKSLNSFLENQTDKKNIVLVITAGNAKWKYSNKEIDAITSASKIEDEEKVYVKILEKIDKILAENKVK